MRWQTRFHSVVEQISGETHNTDRLTVGFGSQPYFAAASDWKFGQAVECQGRHKARPPLCPHLAASAGGKLSYLSDPSLGLLLLKGGTRADPAEYV
ncbi:hypothetical protein ACWGTO_30330 [Mesorhizobium sp. PL10]